VNLRALPKMWLPVVLYRRMGKELGERIWWIAVAPARLDGRRRRWSGLGNWTGIPPLRVHTQPAMEPDNVRVTYQRSPIMLPHSCLGDLYTYRELS